ncbi:MAG: glycosyltransferase family protein [Solirubrobacterales bacterium]
MQAEADRVGMSPGSAIEVGNLPYERVPPLLRAGKILLQPGHPTKLNRLRLPSKLQSYLASGTPTITFAFGCGELLRDREEVLKTYSPAAEELATRIAELLGDEPLYERLADGGPRAARSLFDPEVNARRIVAHYQHWI